VAFDAVLTRAVALPEDVVLGWEADDVPAAVVEEDELLPQAARVRAAATVGRRHLRIGRIGLLWPACVKEGVAG
jgi:hypothetical protein